jgi:hypothetical protein
LRKESNRKRLQSTQELRQESLRSYIF